MTSLYKLKRKCAQSARKMQSRLSDAKVEHCRIYLDLPGAAGQAVQSMTVVIIRENQTTVFKCIASTTSYCLGRNIHVDAPSRPPVPLNDST